MDLFTLRSGDAHFNPFTALIGLETLGGGRELSLAIPVIEDARLARYAVLFHEVTHLWTMRMTGLGAVLSIAAARAWNQWQAHPGLPVELPEQVYHLLGTWFPILEGLATYAELDFTGDEDRDRIHSPVLKVVHFTAPATNGVANHQEFLHTRLSRATEDRLLATLLLEDSLQQHEHAYFSGYVYVKALAARLSALCPRLAAPARMLPLLIRLLCDHPSILRPQAGEQSTAELLGAVHASALSLDAGLLGKLADWIESGDPQEVVWRFDFLDLERSSKCGDLVFQDVARRDLEELVSEDLYGTLGLFRTAGSFYLPAWKSGKLQAVSERSITLRHDGEDVEYVMLSAVDFERMKRGRWEETPGSGLFRAVLATLREAIGREVTAALYIDVASGDPGMVFWIEDRLAGTLPYSLGVLERGDKAVRAFAENLGRGLSLSPGMRSRFGEALRTPASFPGAVVAASRWHLSRMISSLRAADRVLQHKLRSVENARFLAAMYDWCAPPVALEIPPLPEEIASALDRIFDFPGFGGTPPAPVPRFAELMPAFSLRLGGPNDR